MRHSAGDVRRAAAWDMDVSAPTHVVGVGFCTTSIERLQVARRGGSRVQLGSLPIAARAAR